MTKMDLKITDLARHPLTAATSVVAVLGGLLNVPFAAAVWTSLYSTAEGLFGALAVLSFLADHVPVLQSEWVIVPMIVVGGLAFVKKLREWYSSFETNVEDQT